jgi:hypothetical protein
MTLHTFPIPTKINGDQLQNELGATFVYLSDKDLVIDSEKTKAEIEAIIATHKPIEPKEPTVADKLASVGLSIEELKAALGGN